MTVGVYRIINQSNGKVYVGQSVDVEDRIYKHKMALRGNYHKNDHLQKAWNKYGEDSFIFELIKSCKVRYLDRFEKLYIHIYKSMNVKYGYNNDTGGNLNKTLAPQTIEKLSAPRASVAGVNNPSWKDYPRIVKCGLKRGKQSYGIRVNGKTVCKSVDLDLLKQKLENNDFSPIITDKPHIVKSGFDENGNQMYRICKNNEIICSSNNLKLLEEKIKNNDFSPIPNSRPPRIIKSGFQNGKQVYGIYKNGKYIKRSVNLKKLEEMLMEMI